jgi:signal transduction histidine kinase
MSEDKTPAKSRALEAFAMGVAHEVRNLLFGITATIDAFDARFGTAADYSPYLNVIRLDLGRLSTLMNDLMEFGAPRHLQIAPVTLHEPLKDAVSNSSERAQQIGVKVEVSGPALDAQVAADRRQLGQAFARLVALAVNRSPTDGSVRIEANWDPADAASRAVTTIRDEGPALSSEQIATAFEPFVLGRKSVAGIGLCIAQQVIAQHGGTIQAQSSPDGGLTLVVALPLKSDPRRTSPHDR